MMAKKALATNTNTNSAKSSNGDLNHNNVPNIITVPSADPLLSCILAASSSPCSQTSSPDVFYHFHQQLLQQNQQPPVFEELPPRTFPDCPAWKGIHAAIASGGTLGIPAHYRKDCREQPELALPVTYYRPMVYSNSTDPPGLVPFFFSPREEDEEEYGEDEWGVRPSGRPPLYQSSPPAERILKGAPIALVPMYTKPVPKPRAGWRAVADLEAAKPEPPPPAIYHHTLRSLQTAHPEEELDDPQGSFLYHFEEIGSGVRALSFHLPMRRRWTEPVELVMSEALASETPSRRVNAPLFPAPFSLPTGLVRAITVRQIYGGGGVGLSGPAKKQNPLAAARESPLYAVELICDPAEVWLQPALVVGNHVEVLVRLRDATLMGKEAAALPGDHGPLLAEATFELHRSEGAARVVVALYLTTAVYVASAVTAIADGTGGSGRDLTVTGAFPNTIEVEAEVYLRNGFTLRPRRVEIPLVTICPMAVHLRGEPLAVTTAAAAAKGGKGGKRGAKLAASLPCLACKRIATPIYVEPPAVMRCKGKFMSGPELSSRLRIDAFARHFEAEIGAVGAGGPQGSARFNLLQGTVFSALYETDENVFIGAGSGTGKRVAAQFAIMRLFGALFFPSLRHQCSREAAINAAASSGTSGGTGSSNTRRCCGRCHHPRPVQAVYLQPKRSILERLFRRWRVTLAETFAAGGGSPTHFRVVMFTGDPEEDLRLMEGAHLIMSTPYDWNYVATLQSQQYHQSASQCEKDLPTISNEVPVQLYILDDLHLLASDESYEFVLARLRFRAKRQEAAAREAKAAAAKEKKEKERAADRGGRGEKDKDKKGGGGGSSSSLASEVHNHQHHHHEHDPHHQHQDQHQHQHQPPKPARIVALSGRPLENIGEVAAYLDVDLESVFNFTPGGMSSARMVPVSTVVAEVAPPPELVGAAAAASSSSNVPRRRVQLQAMADAAYAYIRAVDPNKPVIVWVPYAEDAFAVAFRLLATDNTVGREGARNALKRGSGSANTFAYKLFPEGTNSAETLRGLTGSAQLRSTLARGIGFLTESSTADERALVERMFRSSAKKLKAEAVGGHTCGLVGGGQPLKPLHVVIVQQALMYDLMLRAYLVIVLDGSKTTYNVGNDQLEADISLDELERLLYANTGRPTADLEAKAVFLCRPSKEAPYVQALAAEYAGLHPGVEALFGKKAQQLQQQLQQAQETNGPTSKSSKGSNSSSNSSSPIIIPPLRPLESGLFSIGEPGGGLGGRPGSTAPLLATLSAEILYGTLTNTDLLNDFLLELFLFRRLAANVTYYVSRLAEAGVISMESERQLTTCGVCLAEELLKWVPKALWQTGFFPPFASVEEAEEDARVRRLNRDVPCPLASRPPIDAIAFNHRVDPAYVAFLTEWCRDFGTALWGYPSRVGSTGGGGGGDRRLPPPPSSSMPLDLSKPKTSAGAAGGKKGGTTAEKPDAEPENAERAFREHVESVSPLKMFVFLTSPLEYLRDDHNHFDVSGGGDGRRLAVRYGEIAILRKMIAGLSKAYGVGYGPLPHSPPPAKEGDKEGVNGRTKDDQKSQKSPPSSPAEPYFLHPEADFAEAQQWADGLLLPSEIGKAREELIVGGVTLPGSSTDCPDVLIEPLRKIFGEGGTAPEEEESLEELYRRLSCKSLPYHQAKAKLLLLYHFARLPLPEAAPWLATEQAEAVMTAHRHVLAAVDIFLHARLLRFALAAMELATALVQAVLPLTGGEDVVLFRKGAKLTDKELQRRKASDLEKKYGLSTPPPSSPSSSSPPAEPIIVGRLDGATIRQISSHMTDGFVGRCFNQHIRGIRRDHLRLMRLLITFKKDEAEKEEREWMMMAAKAGRPRPPPSLMAAIARELSEDLDRFIHGTPEPKLYISQLPEPPEPKSAAGAAAAATAASSSASPEKKKKKEDKKSNQMTVKLVVELKCFPRDHPEVKQSVGDVARQQAAINANIEREIQRQGLLQQYISYEEGTEKDQGKKGKKAGEEAAKYLSVLVRDGTNGGQVKVAKARMLTPAVVEELITRYCDEEGLVYGGPDPEEEEEEDGNGDGNGDGDEEEEESVEEEDDGGVETMDSGNGSGGGGSGTAILSYGKALGFPPERLMLPMFPKPVTEKWWLMLSTPYSGRISTVAFLVGQSGRLLLTVNVPRPVVVHAGDPNYPKVVGRVTASRKPTAYEPPSPLTEVLLLLKNSAYIGRDRLYRLHFFITRKAVRYVGAIEHHLGPR